MIPQTTQGAVIYCRSACISSTQKDGESINPQLTRCQEFARHKGYDVRAIFKDEGVSGNVIDRPGLQAMFKFLHAHPKDNLVIITDDPSRLARSMEVHIELRAAIANAGAKLVMPNIEFREKQDFVSVEHLLAKAIR